MKPFEGSARALGWVRDGEMYPNSSYDRGVVHPQGWWAADWQEALRLSLQERQARYAENLNHAET